MEKLAIACDHGGYELKEAIKKRFDGVVEFIDLGTGSTNSVDYPDFAQSLSQFIVDGKVQRGILICGTGIGISISANRYKEVRAANCTDVTMAKLTRQHNDANVLALGARIIGVEVAFDIVETFINTKYESGRHDLRIKKLS